MKAAIVTFSIKGALLGIKISEIIKHALDNNAITNDKVENICDDTIEDSRAAGIELVTTNERAANIVPKLTVSLSDWVETQFVSCDLLVFVGACGIAVRKIAPFIKDKKSDPAVLVVDDMGGNVISLLSGHIGNANAWTCLVADGIGANPVITTASDCHGKIAIDMFAVNNGLVITDFTLAKDIESALLDGEKIRLIIDEDCAVKLAGDVPEEFINIENEISENSRETDNSCKNILEKDEKIALANSKKGYLQPCDIWHLEDKVKDVLSIGNQTGEGWFLTAEMIEYMEHDIPNIICVQPFACLPNHVVGKGVIKTIREKYPEANISPVDYDPGASETNQANRIKLLMTVAKDNLQRQENEKKALENENTNVEKNIETTEKA